MWISKQAEILYAHNPRTAGNAMIVAFRRMFPDFCKYHPDSTAVHWRQDHGNHVPPGTEGFSVVAAVRNPFARELSFYFWRKRHVPDHDTIQKARSLSFREFMRWRCRYLPSEANLNCGLGSQSRFLFPLTVDHLVQFEQLPEAFTNLPCFAGKEVGLPYHGQSASQPYRLEDYYDDDTMALVRLYAGADFLNYGYDAFTLP